MDYRNSFNFNVDSTKHPTQGYKVMIHILCTVYEDIYEDIYKNTQITD